MPRGVGWCPSAGLPWRRLLGAAHQLSDSCRRPSFIHWSPHNRGYSKHADIGSHQMLGRPHLKSQPQSFAPSIFIFAWHKLGFRDLEMHRFAEFGYLRGRIAASDLHESCLSIKPNSAPRYQARSVPHQPLDYLRLDGYSHADLFLQSRSERSHLGFDVLYRTFHTRVRIRVAYRR